MPSEVTIRVRATGPDRGEIKGQIEAATAGQEATIALRTDAKGFAEDIARAKETAEAAAGDGGTIKIRATIDASGTKEELAAIVAEARSAGATHVTIKGRVEPDDPGGNAFLSWLKGLFGKAESESGSSGKRSGSAFSGAFSSMMQDINFGAGSFRFPVEGIIPAIQALGNLTGILGMIPALAAGAATSLGTFLVGITGLKDTVTAYTQAQDATIGRTAQMATQALSTKDSLISADQAVKQSRQSLEDTDRSTAQSIIQARRNIADASRAQAQAEQDTARAVAAALRQQQTATENLQAAEESEARAIKALSDAKEAAARAIEDAANQEKDAELAHKQAVLDLQQAQDALTAYSTTASGALQMLVQAQANAVDPTKDHAQALIDLTTAQDVYNKAKSNTGGPPTQDVQQLALAVQQAQQRVDETALSYQRSQEDATKATQAGVDGANSVVSAQDALLAAQRQVRDSIQAQADAADQLARTRIDGDQKIADADQKLADTRAALDDAQRARTEGLQKANDAVSAAIRAQALAIAQTSAAAETAAGSMSVFNARMAGLAPNTQDAIRTAIGLGDTWKSLRLEVQQRMFAGASDEIQRLARADLPVLRDGLSQMAGQIAGAGATFTTWATAKTTVGDLSVIFQNSAVAAGDFNRILAAVLRIFQDTGAVGSGLLHQLVGGWADAATKAADFVSHARQTGQLQQWIQTGLDTLHQLWEILKNLVGIIKDVMAAPASFGGGFLGLFQLVTGIVKWLLDNMPFLVPIIEDIFLATRITKFATALIGLTGPWGLVITAAVTAALLIIQNWGPISDFFKAIGNAILGAFQAAWNWLKDNWPLILAILTGPIGMAVYEIVKNWDAIKNGFWAAIRWIGDRWNDFIGFMGDVGRVLWNIGGRIWDGLVSGAKTAVNSIIQIFNLAVDGINTIIKGINWTTGLAGIPAIPLVPHLPHWLAAGGPASGLAIVGEQGPELVRLPSGSQVMPAANTAGARGTGPVRVALELRVVSGGTPLDQAVFDAVRRGVRVIAGGDVQAALGS